MSHISVHLIINFLSNFPLIFFNTNFLFYFNIYTFSNLSPVLPFYLPITLHINIILLLSFCLFLFCLFLFTLSYYKFVTIYSILCMVFSLKKKKKGSLSLSLSLLSLSLNFLMNFLYILLFMLITYLW